MRAGLVDAGDIHDEIASRFGDDELRDAALDAWRTAAGTVALSVPVLTLGAPFSGTIADGQDLYFRLDVPVGRDVEIAASFATAPAAELVERYASPPDRSTCARPWVR